MWFEALLELGHQPKMRFMTDYEWEKMGKYVTVLTNNMDTPCTIKLIAPKGLKATPIFGEAKISKSGKVKLGDRETLIRRWK